MDRLEDGEREHDALQEEVGEDAARGGAQRFLEADLVGGADNADVVRRVGADVDDAIEIDEPPVLRIRSVFAPPSNVSAIASLPRTMKTSLPSFPST